MSWFRIDQHKQKIKAFMNKPTTSLPIFSLSVFLLPEGVTRLRVFEIRYLNLVKLATKAHGFLILSNNKAVNVSNIQWGSWVEIINFKQGKDKVLEIDVKCKSLVEVLSFDVHKDDLCFANVIQLQHWSKSVNSTSNNYLSHSLIEAFKHNTMLNELYAEKFTDNEHWVIARWLELLPVNLEIKNSFVNQHNFSQAKTFVESILIQPANTN